MQLKAVHLEEFERFLILYPRKLERLVNKELQMVQFIDRTLGASMKSVVASYPIGAYDYLKEKSYLIAQD
jgi:hypothetical protein